MAFDIRYIGGIDQLSAYLGSIPRPAWARGVTVHHTWRPTVEQWRGLVTMRALRLYYVTQLGWDRGPHLFVAPDGIWQLSVITEPGIHAGVCNSSCLGVEVVGNYDRQAWQEPILSLATGTLATLCSWIGAPVGAIRGHRDCLPNKSCPGNAIQIPEVRRWVAAWRHVVVVPSKPACDEYRVITLAGANIREGPATSFPIALAGKGVLGYGERVAVDVVIDGAPVGGNRRWAHLADGRGFVHTSLLGLL